MKEKKGILSKAVDFIDKKLKEKAKTGGCCCSKPDKENKEDSSCCKD